MIGLFSCVNSHVFSKISCLRETFVTYSALIGLFSCVSSHVFSKLSFNWKSFLTHTTFIVVKENRPLFGPKRDMPSKSWFFVEYDSLGDTKSNSGGCHLGTLGENFLLALLTYYGGPESTPYYELASIYYVFFCYLDCCLTPIWSFLLKKKLAKITSLLNVSRTSGPP